MEVRTKIVRVAVSAAVSAMLLGGLTTRASAACVRHSSVSALTIAAELTAVYANCYTPPPPCPPRYAYGALETKSIDGYASWNNWIWSGLSTTTFNIVQQNALIATGVSKANVQKPVGKALVKIVFFRDIIVGNGPVEYVVGEKATYGKCVPFVINRNPNIPRD